MSKDKFALGIDYGTESGRAVVVRVRDGKLLSSSVVPYPDGVIAALMVEIRVCRHRERQALGTELKRIHVGKHHLLGRRRNARVHQHRVIAHKEILKKVPAGKQGLDLVDVGIQFHVQLQLGDEWDTTTLFPLALRHTLGDDVRPTARAAFTTPVSQFSIWAAYTGKAMQAQSE